MVDITAWLESRLSCDREPLRPPWPRFERSSFVTDFVRLSGFDRKELKREMGLSNVFAKVYSTNYRLEKKFVNREVDSDF